MGEESLQTKFRKSENIVRGRAERGWLGVGRYANPLNGFSTSVSFFFSFSYCLIKVYVRIQLLYIPSVIFLNTCVKEHSLLRKKCH